MAEILVAIVFSQGQRQKCSSRRAISGCEETTAWRWAAVGDAEAAMEPSCFGLAGGRAQQTGQDHVQWIEAIARLSRWFAPGQ